MFSKVLQFEVNRRVLFTGSALLLDSKSVQPQERTSMCYLELKHTYKMLLFCLHWALLNCRNSSSCPKICIFAFDPKQVLYRNKDIISSVFGKMNCQRLCFRKINKKPQWFHGVRSQSLDCGLESGPWAVLVLSSITSPCLGPQTKHLHSLYLHSSIWNQG